MVYHLQKSKLFLNFPFLRKMASTLPTDISKKREVGSLSFEVTVAIVYVCNV